MHLSMHLTSVVARTFHLYFPVLPYTWVNNKHICLYPKLQGNMRLIMKGKIDHTPKTMTPFW